jgi:serine/threonine-protein kinase
MSPEQVRDASQASARSDIYSLGAVFYEMATGRKVFEGESSFLVMQAQVQGTPVPPKQLEPAIPAAINDAILKALEKDPQHRFPTAAPFPVAVRFAIRRRLRGNPASDRLFRRLAERPPSAEDRAARHSHSGARAARRRPAYGFRTCDRSR